MNESGKTIAGVINAKGNTLIEEIVARQYELQPELNERYGLKGRNLSIQDVRFTLSYLSQALDLSSPSLFTDYVAWLKILLTGLGIPEKYITVNFMCIREILEREVPAEAKALLSRYISEAMDVIANPSTDIPAFIDDKLPLSLMATQYLNALLRGERHIASHLIMEAVKSNVSVKDIYLNVFQRSQYEVGRLWQTNKITVAQEHYCTAATQLVMSQLYPYIFATEKRGYSLVATCVAGELHEIGIRMVADFFEIEGWDTFYYGANTPTSSVIQAIIERKADALGISATMTFHIPFVEDLIQKVRSNDACKDVQILVGGYPFKIDRNLWKKVGADGSAESAEGAIETAEKILKKIEE